jgi:hypothetical protein
MTPLPDPQEIIRSIFDSYVEIFERDTDPAAAWGAFYLARQHGFEVPAKINAEVDRFAGAIEYAAFRLLSKFGGTDGEKDVSLDNESVGRIWKNSTGRDPGTAISMARRSHELAIAVARLCALGVRKTAAVAQVAKNYGSNKTDVWAALKEHSYVRDMGADELGIHPSELLQRSGGT